MTGLEPVQLTLNAIIENNNKMSHADFSIIHFMVFMQYLIIALQFITAYVLIPEHKRTQAHFSLALLFCIFVFCGICGYVAQIFQFKPWFEYTMLLMLIFTNCFFILKNNASVILLGLDTK